MIIIVAKAKITKGPSIRDAPPLSAPAANAVEIGVTRSKSKISDADKKRLSIFINPPILPFSHTYFIIDCF